MAMDAAGGLENSHRFIRIKGDLQNLHNLRDEIHGSQLGWAAVTNQNFIAHIELRGGYLVPAGMNSNVKL